MQSLKFFQTMLILIYTIPFHSEFKLWRPNSSKNFYPYNFELKQFKLLVVILITIAQFSQQWTLLRRSFCDNSFEDCGDFKMILNYRIYSFETLSFAIFRYLNFVRFFSITFAIQLIFLVALEFPNPGFIGRILFKKTIKHQNFFQKKVLPPFIYLKLNLFILFDLQRYPPYHILYKTILHIPLAYHWYQGINVNYCVYLWKEKMRCYLFKMLILQSSGR